VFLGLCCGGEVFVLCFVPDVPDVPLVGGVFRTLLVGVWAQLAPVGELPVVARCRSRVRAEEPTGD